MQALQANNYEVQEHQDPNGARVYVQLGDPMQTHQFIIGQGVPRPIALTFGYGNGLGGPVVWGAPNACNPINSPLNMQQGCYLAIMRSLIGIDINFRDENLIFAVAIGLRPLPAQAAYVQSALGGGGYLTETACALYALVHDQVCSPLIQAQPLNGVADQIIIQISNEVRVSKNLKEFSYNTLIAGNPIYQTIREAILDQYALMFGGQIPQGFNIVSATHLQPH